ncbi:polyphosphate kinase [Klebsiella pneumoniae]|uniref:Polyphosphate kinase n=1 Tax=Klebsiella pneumoniae TaxID=573 RepID=A0A377W3K7_KLEPN|nr:polyphosphate kinase [Klebsiella pneumoniae]
MGNKKSGNPVDTAVKIAPLDNKAYEKALRKLHVELVKLQRWVMHKGLKVCIVFEGRDGAGKGGTIKAITGARQPAYLSGRRLTLAHRARKKPALLSALYQASPGGRRNRDFRSQLV